MAEPSSESIDKPIKTFLDYLALALILEAGASLWRGEDWSRVLYGLLGGAALLVAHWKWGWLKGQVGARFADTANKVATDFRWWLAPFLLLFLYVGVPTFTKAVAVSLESAHESVRQNFQNQLDSEHTRSKQSQAEYERQLAVQKTQTDTKR